MNRKHFLRITSGSLASFAFARAAALPPEGAPGPLGLPDQVAVQIGGEWIDAVKWADRWNAKDASVSLAMRTADLGISLAAPASAVEAVRVRWNLAARGAVTALGDHWERTYGDVAWRPPDPARKLPWYVLIHDGRDTQGFGVKTGAGAICWWQLMPASLDLYLDTRSGGEGVLLGDRTLACANVVGLRNFLSESVFATGRRFCGLLCAKPRLPEKPVYGINDWYFAYGKNSKALILEHTALLAGLATDTANRPFSVIDAGWSAKSPLNPDDCCWADDNTRANENFGDMADTARSIRDLGMRPGLWVRPLTAHHYDPANLLAPAIPGRNDPKSPVLDPTIPENLMRIHKTVSTYREWGYDLVKHDFTTYDILGRWGFEMNDSFTVPGWHFNDRSKTNAEIILKLYQTIRDAAGPMYLIGCNTVGHLSAGLFELNRIGDDTSGKEWARTRKMGVNTLGFRLIQHDTFYAADGDCVGLTDQIPWDKNKQWMQLLAQSGAPLFISAQPSATGAEQKAFIKTCFTEAARPQPVGEPLDWLTNPFPSKWKLDGKEVRFAWD